MSCDSTSAKLNFYIDNRALGFLKARNQIIIEVRIMTKVQLNVWSNVQQRRKIYRQDIKFVWMEKYLRRECIYEYFLWRRSGGWVGWYYDGSAGDIIHSGINYYYYFIIIIILILLLFTVYTLGSIKLGINIGQEFKKRLLIPMPNQDNLIYQIKTKRNFY